ncbi:cartilage matrix protein-like isoform X3 [Dreissena polymorpha]|uniref:cartilage matrix protein-like isoform X3 n=1 Tax=Dreissena polymorpha TaxID=45954 RepID=UPI002263D091|nr:cartilage matrix protein-like isoform X3 [Dreissena polymorpha]
MTLVLSDGPTDFCLEIILLVLSVNEVALQPGPCDNQAFDIVFAVDSSSSIWKPDFERQLTFVRDVAHQFDVGLEPSQTRVGVVTFADDYYLQFHLWQNNRMDLLDQALSRIRHRAGRKTNTAAALKYIAKYMFLHRYGSRSHATHVAIVITDGQSTDRKHTVEAAKLLKDAGIYVFAIGVGKYVAHRELEELASLPSEEFVYEVHDFQSLDKMKFTIANRTCTGIFEHASTTPRRPSINTTPSEEATLMPTTTKGPSPTPADRLPSPNNHQSQKPYTQTEVTFSKPWPPEFQADIDPSLNVTNCGGKPADIYFALDASSSIWPEDFKKQLAFIRDLISLFDITPTKTRVGLVTFSDTVKPIFDFNTPQTKDHLIDQMANISFMSGRTKTADAIRFIHEQGFSRDVARREVAHIVLIFTDGLSKTPHETAREAELAKRDGIYLFSIGIGSSVERTELQDIASDPDDDFVFHVSNFSVLNTIKNILAIKTCSVQSKDYVADAAEKKCTVGMDTDLMFVYDSAQLGIPRARKITKFVYDVTSALDMESGHLKVGRLLENCLSGADTYLTHQKQALDFDDVYFPDLRRMIKRVASVGFAEPYGARRNAKKIAVLFIDDATENLKQAQEEIARLRETHTLVVTIGDTDLSSAAALASSPANDYIVHIPAYSYLHTAKYTLLQKLCKIFSQPV